MGMPDNSRTDFLTSRCFEAKMPQMWNPAARFGGPCAFAFVVIGVSAPAVWPTTATAAQLSIARPQPVGYAKSMPGGRDEISEELAIFEALSKLDLPELPGSVPTLYVPSAKQRAIAYQKSLEPAYAWYQRELQVKVKVPILLAVIDDETQQKLSGGGGAYSTAYILPGLIVFPLGGVEDTTATRNASKAPREYVLYHEAGHIFALNLGIWSGNNFVNELIANIFLAGYIHAERPDLKWTLEGPGAYNMSKPPRYTSLADLDYVYEGVGMMNYVWFQTKLMEVAGFLTQDKAFPDVVRGLHTEFPAAEPREETLNQINGHLNRIRPGVGRMLGLLAGPATLVRLTPSVCPNSAHQGSGAPVAIAVRNDSGNPLKVVKPDGQTATVAAGRWDSFDVKPGAALKLANGSCIVARGTAALAVIDQQ